MKPEAQNIAIAEACPNTIYRKVGAAGWNYYNSKAERTLPCIDGSPCADLNAMHEAEQQFRYPQSQVRWGINYKLLEDIVARDRQQAKDSVSFIWEVAHATAAQRAEAFLKTIGKWKDEE